MVQTHSSKHKEKVTLMLHGNDEIIKHKVGLLNLAEELGNVSEACQIMGLSRDSFYRYRDAVEDGGVEAVIACTCSLPDYGPGIITSTSKRDRAVAGYA